MTLPVPIPDEITFDQKGCARCDADGHPGITFRRLTNPMEIGGAMQLTHWAPCPTNGEPILLLVGKDLIEGSEKATDG